MQLVKIPGRNHVTFVCSLPAGVTLSGNVTPRHEEILTPLALSFIATLHRRFDAQRQDSWIDASK